MPKVAKKAAAKKIKNVEEEPIRKGTRFFDYLRFGESYTSLILGIIVVIIATALLLSFVHNKDVGNGNSATTQQTQNTVQVTQKVITIGKKPSKNTSKTILAAKPKDTIIPTSRPKPAVKPTIRPTIYAKAKPTQSVKKIVKITHKVIEKKIAKANSRMLSSHIITRKGKNVWIVQKGESLWIIAEKKYTSGYNWVDIAKANNLADPSDIHVGDRLVLPNVTPGPSTLAMENPTVTTNDQQFSSTENKDEIAGKIYTVEHGDNLWDIAERAYGDGYKWPDIAKANKLTNPGMIFSGNVLMIPR